MSANAALGCPSGLAPPMQGDQAQDAAAFVRHDGDSNALDILVQGAKCGGCVSKIESTLLAMDGVSLARMNLSNARLRVEWSGALSAQDITAAVVGLGYGARAYNAASSGDDQSKEERRLLIALAVAGFAAANVMLLSVSVWAGADMPAETAAMLHWVSALIALPAALFAGRPFFASALKALKAGHVNMDVPISLAVLLALAMSLYATATGGPEAYFDAAVMLLFFLLIGRFLDARLRRRAYSAANALGAMRTATVSRFRSDGSLEAIKASEIAVGDRILLAPGERLHVNADIEAGEGDVDLRLVNGEVEPARVGAGTFLFAGSVNLDTAFTLRVAARAEDSLLAEIGRMLEAGEQRKSTYRRIADTASRIYVPVVHSVAALALVGWYLAGAGLEHAIFTAIAVLIITCPCALGLAAPVVQIVAAGRLFREGVFLSSGDALERIATVDHIVLDKTGTLTLGDPVLVSEGLEPGALDQAAQLARGSRHPFSRAIVHAAGAGLVASDIHETAGAGVSGVVNGQPARLGRAGLVGVADETEGSRLWFRIGDDDPIAFDFVDHIRPGAADMIAHLRTLGVTAELLSGDNPQRVASAAKAAGIDVWTAHATPVEKADRLETLRRAGKRVLMVGDGLNDAGAIALAHASVAPGGAVDVSRLAADAVFSGEDLSAIETIILVARSARARMRENFGFAALYNIVAVPLALAGLVTPMIAAIAMSSSSLVVTGNALRLNVRRHRKEMLS